jgi:hypothetical protein
MQSSKGCYKGGVKELGVTEIRLVEGVQSGSSERQRLEWEPLEWEHRAATIGAAAIGVGAQSSGPLEQQPIRAAA